MEIIEYNKFNNEESMNNFDSKSYTCSGDCWSDDDSCPNFCDHEWGT